MRWGGAGLVCCGLVILMFAFCQARYGRFDPIYFVALYSAILLSVAGIVFGLISVCIEHGGVKAWIVTVIGTVELLLGILALMLSWS
jgi:hypothetical protein